MAVLAYHCPMQKDIRKTNVLAVFNKAEREIVVRPVCFGSMSL